MRNVSILLFFIISFLFLNYSYCEECPKDKPILKNNECLMTYCLPQEFENKTCIISNNLLKTQWMNNFHIFGDRYLTHICPISNDNGDLFLMAQNLAFGDGNKYIYGFDSNGDGLFYDKTNNNYSSFIIIDFEGRINPEIFKYVENNNKGYLLSTTYESQMYLIDYMNKNYTELRVNLLSQSSDTVFKLKGYEEETYFTDFIYCDKQYNYNECWINLRIFKFNLLKIETILDSPDKINVSSKNKIQCFQTDKNYILCIYTTEEKTNTTKIYNHTLSLFNSKNLNKEYNEIIENNFDSDCSFDYSLQLKENVFVIGYSYPNDRNKIKLMLKKLVIENNNFNFENYISSLDYININEDNKYIIKNGTAKRNSMAKISDNKFSILLNGYTDETLFTYGNRQLVILICTIYNEEKNMNIKYYSINFVLYGRKLIDDLKGYTLNDYFGVLLETDKNDLNQAVFMTFGYINATHDETKIDEKLQLNNTESVIKFNDYIMGIENNLFGYELLGVQILDIPSEQDAGLFIDNITKKKIEKNNIYELNTTIRFILSDKYKAGNYSINFIGLVKEPNYENLNKFSEKVENYPINSAEDEKNYYEPKILRGKQVKYTFSLSCYDSCLTCKEISIDPKNQKCLKCKPNFYFQIDTSNCFSELEGYYLDKDSEKFLPCYLTCKTCSQKEESSIKMNCDSCITGYKYYTRSTNCLKCPRFVNYEQTGCIDEIPEGYFVDDEFLGTLGKCHENCKTCDDYPSFWEMNCIECKYYNPKFIPVYDGDCPDEDYIEYEEEDYGEEEYLGGECPRERPILIDKKECSDEFCPESDFEGKKCIIANMIIKEQWLNKFHIFGNIDISYISTDIGLNNELFLFAQSQTKGNKENYLYAFASNGEGLFLNKSNNLNYSFKKLGYNYDSNYYIDSIKYAKDFSNNNEYLISTQYDEKMIIYNISKENPDSKEIIFNSYAYSTDTIFQIDDDTYIYFTDFISCQYDDPSDNCYINMRKFSINNMNINIINEMQGNVTISSKNKLTCLFSEFDFVQCTYTTQEKKDSNYIYNHVIGFYDEETFELIDTFILKENFNTDACFDSMIQLKEDENLYVIAYSSSANIITVLLKKIGYNVDYSEIVMDDYIKEIPFININENNLYVLKGAKSDRNSLYRLDDNKFAIIVNNFKNTYSNSQANGIVIFIFNIYNNNKNINVRHYSINFKMYNTYVEGDIRPYLLNNFFGIAIELTSPLDRKSSRASFFTFGYVNSTDAGIDENFIPKGASESKVLKINDYITGIENNLFGYKFLGVKILELPDENKSGYFINAKNETKIKVDEIVDINCELKFIIKNKAEENIYHILFAGIVQEPDYNTLNKFAEKLESYPNNNAVSEESFYTPKNIIGKKIKYSFTIGEIKNCYKNCKTCTASSINIEDQKCIECNNGYYFKEGTKNCYNEAIPHYYFNEETKVYSPCYKDCLTCSSKETNSTHMNCLSCENKFNYYKKSSNCLKCENYINYLQTECIKEIPDGYYLSDKDLGTIEKCHDLCKTCNKKSEIINNELHMNCLTCLYINVNFNSKIEGNCPDSENKDKKEDKDKEKDKEKDEEKDIENNSVLIWVIPIIIIIVVIIIGIVFYLRYKRNKGGKIENDYNDFRGQNISMEEGIGIN